MQTEKFRQLPIEDLHLEKSRVEEIISQRERTLSQIGKGKVQEGVDILVDLKIARVDKKLGESIQRLKSQLEEEDMCLELANDYLRDLEIYRVALVQLQDLASDRKRHLVKVNQAKYDELRSLPASNDYLRRGLELLKQKTEPSPQEKEKSIPRIIPRTMTVVLPEELLVDHKRGKGGGGATEVRLLPNGQSIKLGKKQAELFDLLPWEPEKADADLYKQFYRDELASGEITPEQAMRNLQNMIVKMKPRITEAGYFLYNGSTQGRRSRYYLTDLAEVPVSSRPSGSKTQERNIARSRELSLELSEGLVVTNLTQMEFSILEDLKATGPDLPARLSDLIIPLKLRHPEWPEQQLKGNLYQYIQELRKRLKGLGRIVYVSPPNKRLPGAEGYYYLDIG